MCILALFLTFPPLIDNVSAVEGFEVNGDASIRPGWYCKLPFVMATDGVLEFTIDVRSGPNIDVILIPTSELGNYQNGNTYTYYPGGTSFDCDEADGSVFLRVGTYYFILSNDGSASASVHYTYTPTGFSTGSDDEGYPGYLSSIVIIVMIAVIAIVIILTLAYASEMKKKRNAQENRPTNESTNVMYCRHRGERTSGDATYCERCGGKLR